jgi:multidrug resistance protein, MATE family
VWALVLILRTPPETSLRADLRDTLALAGPIVLNQVGHMSMGLVDTLVAGRISTTALAGLGLAANFFWTFTSICVGCLLALDTYFSQAVGAGDHKSLNHYFRQSFWSCAFVAMVSGVCVIIGAVLYIHFAAAGAMRSSFSTYIWNITWCVPSIFLYVVMLRYWQARHRVMPFTIIILAANALNLVACFGFGLGKWGLPKLGIQGIALSTVICRYAMLVAALVFTWTELRPRSIKLVQVDWLVQRQFLKLGLPAAGHTALEIGAFTIATFVAGALGAAPLAAHHVSLMMAAFTFMFPLGFSAAAAVRVGMFVGAGEPERARRAGWLCIAISVTVMSCFAIGYLVFPRVLLGCFTHDPAVVEIGVKILVLVALFQIADGTQVSTTGALRGLGNTRAAMIANLIGHYPIGLALGLVLCFAFGLGAVGLWTGLAAGLTSVAILLVRQWRAETRDVSRLKSVLSASLP